MDIHELRLATHRLSTTVVLVWELAIGKFRNYQTPLPADRFLKPNFYKYNITLGNDALHDLAYHCSLFRCYAYPYLNVTQRNFLIPSLL